jgi:transposase
MPRTSPYRIVLDDAEKAHLQRTASQYTAPYRDVVRAKVVLFAAQGLQNKEIGERIDLPRQVVAKWRKRFFEKRLAGLQEHSRRGRPRAFSP